MGWVTPDILMDVRYNFEDFSKTTIYTNAKAEVLDELFSGWLQNQIGRGADPAPMVEREEYQIKIGLVISDDGDEWITEADTGNKGLTVGIIAQVLKSLPEIPVKALGERP